MRVIIKKQQRCSIEKQIHLVWYCIDEPGARFLSEEETWIKELEAKKINVLVLLTKTYNDEFFEYLKKQSLPEIIRVGTEPKEIVEQITKQASKKVDTPELEKLVERTTELLPDIARELFINALSRIEFKKKAAYRWLILNPVEIHYLKVVSRQEAEGRRQKVEGRRFEPRSKLLI